MILLEMKLRIIFHLGALLPCSYVWGVLGLKFPTDEGQLVFCVKAKTLINNYSYNFENRLSDIFCFEYSSQISNCMVKFLSFLELED